MKKRLQILLDEEEYRETRRIALRQRVSVSEWVRQALRRARHETDMGIDAKLGAIATATRHEFPTADIDQMLDEIDAGRNPR